MFYKSNHAQPWPTIFYKINCGQPWLIMDNYYSTLHCGKDCLNMKINHFLNDVPTLDYDKDYLNMLIMVNHDKPRLIMIKHGKPCSTSFIKSNMVIHDQSWSYVALSQTLSWYEKQPWLCMVNHGPVLHCDKDCLNMKINHCQPCLF